MTSSDLVRESRIFIRQTRSEHIKQAGIEAIENNQTKYTPAAGLMDLRKAACYRLKEDCGLDYEPTQIVVASGAKHSVYIALMTLCNPGDEVGTQFGK